MPPYPWKIYEHQLTKESVCETLSSVVKQWKHPLPPPFNVRPVFHVEAMYAECFYFFFTRLPVSKDANIVPLIQHLFENASNLAFKNICRILDQNKTDGRKIFRLISDEKLILRRDRMAYNRQIPGKGSRGLKAKEWNDYNNYLLVKKYWDGLLLSQEKGFQVVLPEDAMGPIELLLSEKTKPLWGMRAAAQEIGCLYDDSKSGDGVNLIPYAALTSIFWKKNKE